MRTHTHTVTQSCPTLCNPMNCSLSVSSVHGIIPARILEWVAFSLPRGVPNLGVKPASLVSPALAGTFFFFIFFFNFKFYFIFKPYNGLKTISLTTGAGKSGQPLVKGRFFRTEPPGTVNIRTKCVFELWFSLAICPRVGLLDHMVALFSVF